MTQQSELERTDHSLSGMSCTTCASTIEESLEAVDGVAEASVNFATERADVQHDSEVSVDLLVEAVEDAGYDVREDRSREFYARNNGICPSSLVSSNRQYQQRTPMFVPRRNQWCQIVEAVRSMVRIRETIPIVKIDKVIDITR